jgi:hypothetical protein
VQGAAGAVLSVCVQQKSFISQPDKSTISIDSHHHDDCHKQADNNATGYLPTSLPCDDTSCNAYSNTPIVSDYAAPMLRNNTSAVPTLNKKLFLALILRRNAYCAEGCMVYKLSSSLVHHRE